MIKECKKRNNKDRALLIVFGALIFIFMYIFYTSVEPMMVCDPDDWTYISYIRPAIPLWKNWNPTKIFPETIMGMLGNFSAFCIYPISGDYIWSFTYVYAFVVSFFVTLYFIGIALMIKKMCNTSTSVGIATSLVAFCLHFLFFKTASMNNKFMLTASNLNCFMNYLVPLILNIIIAFKVIECNGIDIIKTNSYIKIGSYILIFYLAIFSNMVVNIVLLAPVIFLFLQKLILDIKSKKKINIDLIKSYIGYIYVFILEIICLIFEYNGGRARSLGFSLHENLNEVINDLKIIISTINKKYFIFSIITMVSAIIYSIKNNGIRNNNFIKLLIIIMLCFVLCTVYIMALYVRIGDHKILRSENVMVMFVYFALIFAFSFAYIIKNVPKTKIILPILIYILLTDVVSGGRYIYKGSISYYNYDVDRCYEVNNNIIEQFKKADMDGKKVLELVVPKGLGKYDFTGQRISTTLYTHGLINNLIYVKTINSGVE